MPRTVSNDRDRHQAEHQHIERAERRGAPAPCRSPPGRTAARPGRTAAGRTRRAAPRSADMRYLWIAPRNQVMSNRRVMSDNPARRVNQDQLAVPDRLELFARHQGRPPRRAATGPEPCLRRPFRPAENPPSLEHAMAGSGVLASRDQSVRWARALSPRPLAHRSISGAPILLVPSRCAICPASAATPRRCSIVTSASSPGSTDLRLSTSVLTCGLQGAAASGVRLGQQRRLAWRGLCDRRFALATPGGTKLDAMAWLSRATPAGAAVAALMVVLLPGPPSSTSCRHCRSARRLLRRR